MKPDLSPFRRPSVREVSRMLARMPRRRRERLIRDAKLVLASPKLSRDENLRIASAQLLLATSKSSLSYIERLLNDFSSRAAHEVHFTLFCFMDLTELPRGKPLRRTLHRLAKNYLMHIKDPKASSHWMVGHLLGDHWKTKQALQILLHAALNAPYEAGRDGARYGLEDAVKWVPQVEKKRIQTFLQQC